MAYQSSLIVDMKLYLAQSAARRNVLSNRVGYTTGLFDQTVTTLSTNMASPQTLPVLTNNSNTYLYTDAPVYFSMGLASQVTASGGTIVITGGTLNCSSSNILTSATVPPAVNNVITLSGATFTVTLGTCTVTNGTAAFTGCVVAPPATTNATGNIAITMNQATSSLPATTFTVTGGTTTITGGTVSTQGTNTLISNGTVSNTGGTISLVGGSVVVNGTSSTYSGVMNGLLAWPFPITSLTLQNSSITNTVDVVLIQC